jgi:hypothetical protein
MNLMLQHVAIRDLIARGLTMRKNDPTWQDNIAKLQERLKRL